MSSLSLTKIELEIKALSEMDNSKERDKLIDDKALMLADINNEHASILHWIYKPIALLLIRVESRYIRLRLWDTFSKHIHKS